MRKHLLSFFLAFIAITFCFFSNAKTDDPDGEPIPIEYNDPGEAGDPIFRSGVIVPIEAYYCAENQQIRICFIYNVETVSVRLTNLTTLSSNIYLFDSSIGNCLLPITMGSGNYRIEFLTEDGLSFQGFVTVF